MQLTSCDSLFAQRIDVQCSAIDVSGASCDKRETPEACLRVGWLLVGLQCQQCIGVISQQSAFCVSVPGQGGSCLRSEIIDILTLECTAV
jgi:hypothetical protein